MEDHELDEVSDENLRLKLESDVLSGVVSDHVKEYVKALGVKLEKEKDTFKNGFDLKVEELNRLNDYVIGLEEKRSSMEILVCDLKSENGRLVKERKDDQDLLKDVNKEKDALKRLFEMNQKDIETLLNHKSDQDDVILELKEKITKLEEMINKLEEYGERMRKEVSVLQDMVMDLEKNLRECLEKEIVMKKKSDVLPALESELKRVMKDKRTLDANIKMLRNALAQAELKKQEADKALEAIKTNDTIREELEKSLIAERDYLKTKLEAVGMVADRSLMILKRVVSPLTQPQNQGDGTLSQQAELEWIEAALESREDLIEKMKSEAETMQAALESREELIEKMKSEAETMQQSLNEARGKKDFWAKFSSLITISAAASLAHAAFKSRS